MYQLKAYIKIKSEINSNRNVIYGYGNIAPLVNGMPYTHSLARLLTHSHWLVCQ